MKIYQMFPSLNFRIDVEEYSTKYYRESNWEILWYKYEVIMYKGW